MSEQHDITRLASIVAAHRILLLPHCLRRAETCKARYDKAGLQCVSCTPDCAINRLREAALRLGYHGVCVAPGGRLAVNYISEHRPKAIVAIACEKELEEGVNNVHGLAASVYRPLIVIIPLTRDGCVDTEVDVERALDVLSIGCAEPSPVAE